MVTTMSLFSAIKSAVLYQVTRGVVGENITLNDTLNVLNLMSEEALSQVTGSLINCGANSSICLGKCRCLNDLNKDVIDKICSQHRYTPIRVIYDLRFRYQTHRTHCGVRLPIHCFTQQRVLYWIVKVWRQLVV